MLEADPGANLNREIPVTPSRPKPKQHFQHILDKMLPDINVECFKVLTLSDLLELYFYETVKTWS